MIEVLSRSWALFLGVLLLMVGNGLQGTLLGIRGSMEGFTTFEMSLIMAAYFAGFLGGSQATPELIRRVGHVRVFAALGSLISAALILFPALTEPWAWVALRVMIGFCFSGVYVTAESWINNAASNENRGTSLSLYMIVQMAGIVTAQGLIAIGDPSGFILFIVPSVLVSISFAPILLAVTPTPSFASTKQMGFGEIFRRLPLSCVGMLLTGGIFSAMFGMAAVYGTAAGFSVPQISAFVAVIYVGGLALQFPIGAVSDRVDRRRLIVIVALAGAAASAIGMMSDRFEILLIAAFLIGGSCNPLYALLIAHANDHLELDDMAGVSGRLLFLNGVGAVIGPLVTGWLLSRVGPSGFYVFISGLLGLLALYTMWRMRRRPALPDEETGGFVPVTPSASVVTVDALGEVYAGHAAEPGPAPAAESTASTSPEPPTGADQSDKGARIAAA